ncbi:hypothetical protein ACWD5Q_06740 [Streptomyces sp. NPDC002513]
MATEVTSRTPDVGQMRFALDLIRWYSIHFPELPAPYAVVQAHPSRTVLGLQLDSPAHFEMWREALEFDAENVELVTNGNSSWLRLEQETCWFQVVVQLTGHGVPDVAPRLAEVAEVAA